VAIVSMENSVYMHLCTDEVKEKANDQLGRTVQSGSFRVNSHNAICNCRRHLLVQILQITKSQIFESNLSEL